MMAEYRSSVLDTNQRPVPGVAVIIRKVNGDLASLMSAEGVAILQPLTTDEFGAFSFYAADGFYNLEYRRGGALVGVDNNIAVGSAQQNVGPPGPSNYDLWLEAGNTGTLQDFLDSLRGPPSPGTVSVLDFGAKGDGVTLNRLAFNQAILAAQETGATVIVPPGDYAFDGSFDLVEGSTIIGVDGAVLRASAVGPSLVAIMAAQNCGNIRVEGLTFDGDAQAFSSDIPVTQFFNCNNVSILRNRFRNTRGIAVNLSTNIVDFLIDGNNFKNCGQPNGNLGPDRTQAIALTEAVSGNSKYVRISDNHFEDQGLDCISLNNTWYASVQGNSGLRCGAGLLYNVAGSDSRHWNVSGNTIRSENGLVPVYPSGIDLPNVSDSVISGNVSVGNGGPGIGIFEGSNNNTITGNVCMNNCQQAETVFKAGLIVIGNNNTVVGNTCTDDQITKTQQYGIIFDERSAGNVVNSNKLTGNVKAQIAVVNYGVDQSLVLLTRNGEFEDAAINVARFGVVGDGITDDTKAMQSLADYINSLYDGARVDIGRLKIRINDDLTFTKSVFLCGTSVSASSITCYGSARIIFDGNRTTNPFFGLENLTIATDGIHATSPLKVDYSPHVDGALTNTFQMQNVVIRGRNSTSGFVNGIQLFDCPWPKLKNVTIIGDFGTPGGFTSDTGINYIGQDGSPSFEGVRAYSVRNGIYCEGEMEGYVVNDCEFVSVQRGFTAKDTTNGLQPLCSITNSHFNCEERAIVLEGITEFNITGNDIYCQGALGAETANVMVDITPTRATGGSNTTVCSGAIHGNAFNGDGGFAASKTAVRIRGGGAGIELYRIYGNHYQGLSVGRLFDAGTNGVQVDEASETFVNVVTRHTDNGSGNTRQMRTVAGSSVGVTDTGGQIGILYGASAAFTEPPIPVVCGGDGNGGETFSVVESSRSNVGCSVRLVRAGGAVASGQTFRINWIASGI